MRKAGPLLCLVFSLPLFFLSSQDSGKEGRSITPYFDREENLVLIYESRDGGLLLGKAGTLPGQAIEDEHVLIGGTARNPFARQDPFGRIWVAWEERHPEGSQAFLGRLEEDRLADLILVSQDQDGENSSPCFDFDSHGNPWVAWINRSPEQDRILVKNPKTGEAWQAGSSFPFSLHTPKLIIDRLNTIWLFWTGTREGRNEILSSRFSGSGWSENFSLKQRSRFPCLAPDVSLDENGLPWVVWTAYDGEDYEVELASWDGYGWSDVHRVTDNQGLADFSPSLAFLPGNVPVLAWSRAGLESHIFLKVLVDGDRREKILAGTAQGRNRNPSLAVSAGRLGLSWENVSDGGSFIQTRIFSLAALFEERDKPKAKRLLPFKPRHPERESDAFDVSVSLDEKKYIAFGDSITYGVLARKWFPDKGYVPRLELLLKSCYGEASVLNRGFPGEQTWEGLARLESILAQDKARFLLLMEGTNDMTDGLPSETAAFNLGEMVKKALRVGVYPLLATVIPRSDELWNTVKARTLLLNQKIKDIPPLHSLPLVDQYQTFISHPGGYLKLFSDGAHPNEPGYQKMAETWYEEISRLPWPPAKVSVERKLDQILFYETSLNLIRWEHNPLLVPDANLASYLIYRKREGAAEDFKVIAVVPADRTEYLDKDILPSGIYTYYLLAKNNKGVTGMPSSTATDR